MQGGTDHPDRDNGGNENTMTKWLLAIGVGVALGLLPVIFGMPGFIVCGVSSGVMVGAVGARRFAQQSPHPKHRTARIISDHEHTGRVTDFPCCLSR